MAVAALIISILALSLGLLNFLLTIGVSQRISEIVSKAGR